jgi:hypothetical protein
MKVAVITLREKGRPIPKWQLHRAERHDGHLTIREEHDKALHRTCRIARVVKVNRFAENLLPPLFDATLIWMSNDQMAITGFERDTSTGSLTDYAQTWLCEDVDSRS